MAGMALDLLRRELQPYLQGGDPFANGGSIDPNILPDQIARIAQQDAKLRDGIDSEQELRSLMEMVNRNSGDLNGLPRPSFDNLGGMTSADMLQALIDWIQSGGPEANKKISRPAPVGNLSSPSNYSSQPTSWNGGGGSSGGSSGGGVASGAPSGGTSGTPSSGSPSSSTARSYPAGQVAENIKDAKKVELTAAEKAEINWDSLNPQIREAAMIAKGMGLTVTSGAEGHDGDGVHTSGSHHYKGQAIDVAESGKGDQYSEKVAQFVKLYAGQNTEELFYDHLEGHQIGGHMDHAHLAIG